MVGRVLPWLNLGLNWGAQTYPTMLWLLVQGRHGGGAGGAGPAPPLPSHSPFPSRLSLFPPFPFSFPFPVPSPPVLFCPPLPLPSPLVSSSPPPPHPPSPSPSPSPFPSPSLSPSPSSLSLLLLPPSPQFSCSPRPPLLSLVGGGAGSSRALRPLLGHTKAPSPWQQRGPDRSAERGPGAIEPWRRTCRYRARGTWLLGTSRWARGASPSAPLRPGLPRSGSGTCGGCGSAEGSRGLGPVRRSIRRGPGRSRPTPFPVGTRGTGPAGGGCASLRSSVGSLLRACLSLFRRRAPCAERRWSRGAGAPGRPQAQRHRSLALPELPGAVPTPLGPAWLGGTRAENTRTWRDPTAWASSRFPGWRLGGHPETQKVLEAVARALPPRC